MVTDNRPAANPPEPPRQDWSGYTVHDPVTHIKAGQTYRHKSSAVRRARRYPVGQVATVQQWDSACESLGQWLIEGRAELAGEEYPGDR